MPTSSQTHYVENVAWHFYHNASPAGQLVVLIQLYKAVLPFAASLCSLSLCLSLLFWEDIAYSNVKKQHYITKPALKFEH